MDAPVSSSLGAMSPLLGKLDELFLATSTAPSIQQIRTDLGITSTRLVELSMVEAPSLAAKYWMKDARELSYDMEDCLDQLAAGCELEATDWIDRIAGFRSRVEEANRRYERYNLDSILCSTNIPIDHRLKPAVVDDDGKQPAIEYVGMEGPMDELHRWLTDDAQELKVVSIVGVGGVGKSTFAQKLWRKLGGQFDCRAFVHTAKKPDMRRILRSILSQVRPRQEPEACEVHNLIEDLRNHLLDKRYFIIVEDLWDTSVWDVVSRAFPKGNCGSRMVTTTKFEEVALTCCGYHSKYVFKIKPLSEDLSKELIAIRVFGSGKGCPQHWNDILAEITNKCGGLPLALNIIANLLSCQREVLEHWKYVRDFLCNSLRRNPTFDEILKQVVNLCYNSLPHCLKTCLLYISIYPENYTFTKEDLVKQWAAEGFLCSTKGEEIMAVAVSYFDRLVNLGLIQPMDINYKVVHYAVNHMVLGIITYKSIEENFITVMDTDCSQMSIELSDKVRRLSLHFGSATYATMPAGIGLSQVRSFTFIGLFNCLPSIVKFKIVRVVILHFLGDHGNLSLNLRKLGELSHLKYLQIKCNIIVELPNQIQGLKHLEALEIRARTVSIPTDIFHLPILFHLRLRADRNLSPLIAKSFSLDPIPSGMISSLDHLNSPPNFLQTFEVLPPIGVYSRLPEGIRQLRKLRILKIAIRQLMRNDIDIISGLPVLTVVSLHIRQSMEEIVVFHREAFPALDCLKLSCSVLYLTFQEEAMPNLRRLKLGFNAHRGELFYVNMLYGIEHLKTLQEVVGQIGLGFGAGESEWAAAEYAFKNAISRHSSLTSFNIRRVDGVDEENWEPQFLDQTENFLLSLSDKTESSRFPGCIDVSDQKESSSHSLGASVVSDASGMIAANIIKSSQITGSVDGSRGNSGGSVVRASGGRKCKKQGCEEKARGKTFFCTDHGGGKRCDYPGCTKSAEEHTNFCLAHISRRCMHEGCFRCARRKTDFCSKHGGGKKGETHKKPSRSAESRSGATVTHGGAGICKSQGCTGTTDGVTMLCEKHRMKMACSFPGCTKMAWGPSAHCVPHGGGKRCKFLGCTKSARLSTDFCKAHGGGGGNIENLCSWRGGESSVGGGEKKCNRIARGRSGLCAAHSALVLNNRVHCDGTIGPAAAQLLQADELNKPDVIE
uniref:NB-ARC domain-containing protein n=1 Tax=Oryza punctata TaxID=4537 RepID=A0A0E0MDZ9_ORYPU